MFCPHCGKDIENGSKSCSFCNKAIDQEYTAPPGMQGAQVSSEFSLEKEMSVEKKEEPVIAEQVQEPAEVNMGAPKNSNKLPIILSVVIMLVVGLISFFLTNKAVRESSGSEKQAVQGGTLGSFYVGQVKAKLKDGYNLRCSARIEYDKNNTEYSELSGNRTRIKKVFTSVLGAYGRNDIDRSGLSKEIERKIIKKLGSIVGEGIVISLKLNFIRFIKGYGGSDKDADERESETSDTE